MRMSYESTLIVTDRFYAIRFCKSIRPAKRHWRVVVRSTVDTVLVVWTQVVLAAVSSVIGVRAMQCVRIDHQYRSAPVTIVTAVLSVML